MKLIDHMVNGRKVPTAMAKNFIYKFQCASLTSIIFDRKKNS